jgi:LysR family transcriptional regulator for bpeEF and oprC
MRSSTTLQVDCPRGLARTIVAPSLPRLLEQHRDLSIRIQEYDRLFDLAMTARCVVLTIDDTPRDDLIVYSLASVRLVTCASKEFLAIHGTPMQPSDLNPGHCIQVCRDPNAAAVAWEFRRADERKNINPASGMIFADEASAAAAAMRGGGFVQLPQYEVEGAIACELLTEVLAEWSVSRVLTALTPWHPVAELTRVQIFLRFLRTLLPDQAPQAIGLSRDEDGPETHRRMSILEA